MIHIHPHNIGRSQSKSLAQKKASKVIGDHLTNVTVQSCKHKYLQSSNHPNLKIDLYAALYRQLC